MKSKFLVLPLAAGLMGTVALAPTFAATTNSVVAGDTYVSSTARSANYGTATELRVDGRTAQRKDAFLKVAVPGVPTGEEVDGIQLRLRPSSSASLGVKVYRTGSSWEEGTLTWNTMPN